MTSNLKEKCRAVAVALRPTANLRISKAKNDVPMLAIPRDARTEAVLNCWFEDLSNIQQVEAEIRKNPSKNLRSRLDGWYPIVYGNLSRAGPVKPPFPGQHVVLVALEDLDERNGLSRWKNGPDRLIQGEWVQFSDDKEHMFMGQGGGIALLLLFEKKV